MTIGNVSNGAEAKAVDLRFTAGRLVLVLDDEREVSVPLSRYPTLQKARPSARKSWKRVGDGFYWPTLDLDLSVRGLISGLPEVVPAPPKRGGTKGAARPARTRVK